MSVKLRYVELEANKVFNWLNPQNITCWLAYYDWHKTWWEPETVERRKRFGEIWTNEFDKITNHFSKLEKSIRDDGIIYPINTATGPLRDAYLGEVVNSPIVFPPEYYDDISKSIYSHTFGGSRLTIAQKHNITVPCIVHDFSNLFEDAEEVTQGNMEKWFANDYIFASGTPYLRLKKHSHIGAGKYSGMNNETRIAQQEAKRITKEKIDEQYNLS